MLSPRAQLSSIYGPVPIGFSIRSPVPPVDSMYSLGSIANDEKATFTGKAGSGAHIVKRTVDASTAAISLIRPVYGASHDVAAGDQQVAFGEAAL